MPVRVTLFALVGLLGLTQAACSTAIQPTHHCSPVIAKRPEASLIYPGSVVLQRDSHEGSANVDAGEPGMPWAAQSLGVEANETVIFDWYRNWLSARGWSHTKDQHPTDTSGQKVSDVSSWEKGDETFDIAVDLSQSARSRFPVTPEQLLVTTDYMAPGSVLGCQ